MARQALILLSVVLIFGVLVPWYKGVTILQPTVILAYALMALLFVAPAAAEFWSAIPSPPSGSVVLGRIAAIVGYGWGIAVAMLATALVTLNLVNRTERFFLPPRAFLTAIFLFSLTAAAAVAVVCALVSSRFSGETTKAIVRAFFLLVLFGLAFGSRILPESWQIVLEDHSTRRAITRLAWQGSAMGAAVALLGSFWLLRSSAQRRQPATNLSD